MFLNNTNSVSSQENFVVPAEPKIYSPQLAFPFLEPLFYLKATSKGYFSLLQKLTDGDTRQSSYPMGYLPEVLRALDRTKDTYLTPNQFFRKNRRVVSLAQMNAGFSDLDTYRVEPYCGVTPEAQAMSLLEFCSKHSFPEPSIILFSGRGLQVKFIFDPPIPSGALHRWNACQAFIIKTFKPFGADPACSSASSVLRLDRTINTKSGEYTRVLWPLDGVKPTTYKFDEFAARVLPFTREQVREFKAERSERKRLTSEVSGIFKTYTLQRLYHTRLNDLRILAHLRGYDGGNPDGERDPFLFYGATFLSWISDPGLPLFLEIAQLAREWCPRWPKNKIMSHVSSVLRMAKAQKRYRVTNQRLIEMLQIETHEERELATIVSREEALRRDRERDTARRRAAGAMEREKYEAQARERKGKALELQKTGLKISEIAKQLNLSRMHVYRLIAKV